MARTLEELDAAVTALEKKIADIADTNDYVRGDYSTAPTYVVHKEIPAEGEEI